MKTLFALLTLYSLKALSQENLVLSLGERKAFPLSSAASVWIENKQIITATAEGNSVVLRPQKIGTSLLRLQGRTQQVQVVNPLQFQSFSRLREICARTLGLSVGFKRGTLGVEGTLYQLGDWKKIAARQLSYVMKSQLSPALQEEAQIYFNELLRKSKLPKQALIFSDEVEIRLHPKSIFRAKYEQVLSPYGIQIVLDAESLETAPTIKVQITVAEVRRDQKLLYGLRWPSTYSASLISNVKGFVDPTIYASAFESGGFGKILASPNIICRSGKEAEFLAGGEFPIKLMNYKIQDIIWKKYGILLKVQPKADSSGRMSLSIETEVSTLDESRTVDGIPGILTNHVSSHFDLARPQTIALSGLIKNENGNNFAGLPMLAKIPILGALFSSKEYKENRSELVIFVRPSILEDEDLDKMESPKHIGDLK